MKIGTILFPTDFSKQSDAPVSYVRELAKRCRCSIVVLHVIEKLEDISHFPFPERTVRELSRERRRIAMDKLRSYAGKIFGRNARVSLEIAEGLPFSAIVATARKKKVSIIVMGTHGRGGLGGFLIGSNAERVVKTAPCPVLTVKGGA